MPFVFLDDQSLNSIYAAIKDGGVSRSLSHRAPATDVVIGGVIIIPDSSIGESYLQGQSHIKFQNGLLNKSLLIEDHLFVAAHEATHIKLTAKNRNTEMGAEMGAYDFVNNNPSFFPILSDPKMAQSVLAGERALWTFITGGRYGDDKDVDMDYMKIPFCSPTIKNCDDVTSYNTRLDIAQLDVMKKVTDFIEKSDSFPNMPKNLFQIVDLQHMLRATTKNNICMNGKSNCDLALPVTDPSNPLLLKAIDAVRQLKSEGVFRANTEESIFVDNLIAGADFYLKAQVATDAPSRNWTAPTAQVVLSK
jgi:hypothetical protein